MTVEKEKNIAYVYVHVRKKVLEYCCHTVICHQLVSSAHSEFFGSATHKSFLKCKDTKFLC